MPSQLRIKAKIISWQLKNNIIRIQLTQKIINNNINVFIVTFMIKNILFYPLNYLGEVESKGPIPTDL